MIDLFLTLGLSGIKDSLISRASFIYKEETCTDMVRVRTHPDIRIFPQFL